MSLLITKQSCQAFACLEITNQNVHMDMKEIRRKRLADWFSDRTLPLKDKSYISQLITGQSSSFGERAARRLERDYGMGDGYLDNPPEDPDATDTKTVALDEREKLLLQLFDRLPESEKTQFIALLKDKVETFDKLFNEMLKARDVKDILKSIKK
ncbi:TPA: hypothetical protein ACSTJZ_003151 [Serratia fonticola]|uniref:hypothetical protein n=1 Tax=Serratia fonticola TaxID=47917 RepID=UPI0034C65C1F